MSALGAFGWRKGNYQEEYTPESDEDDYYELQEDKEEEIYYSFSTPTSRCTSVNLNYWEKVRSEGSYEKQVDSQLEFESVSPVLTPVNTHLVRQSPFLSNKKQPKTVKRRLLAKDKRLFNQLQKGGNALQKEKPLEALIKYREALAIIEHGRSERQQKVAAALMAKIKSVEDSINPGPSPQKIVYLLNEDEQRRSSKTEKRPTSGGKTRKRKQKAEQREEEPGGGARRSSKSKTLAAPRHSTRLVKAGASFKSAWHLFCEARRAEYMDDGQMTEAQVTQALSKDWRKLSPTKRQKYDDKAERLRKKSSGL